LRYVIRADESTAMRRASVHGSSVNRMHSSGSHSGGVSALAGTLLDEPLSPPASAKNWPRRKSQSTTYVNVTTLSRAYNP